MNMLIEENPLNTLWKSRRNPCSFLRKPREPKSLFIQETLQGQQPSGCSKAAGQCESWQNGPNGPLRCHESGQGDSGMHMYMHMYECMYMYIYMCVYMNILILVHAYCAYLYIYICIYIHLYVCICIYLCVCLWCMYGFINKCKYILYIYVRWIPRLHT